MRKERAKLDGNLLPWNARISPTFVSELTWNGYTQAIKKILIN